MRNTTTKPIITNVYKHNAIIIPLAAMLFLPLTIKAQNVENRLSTAGPVPPAGIDVRGFVFTGVRIQAATIIPGVPAYEWRYGCGPTAVGMVLGYYDGHGYDDLLPGDSSTQSDVVDEAIASTEHYNDYSLPIDSPPTLLPDRSELPSGDEHADNSLADLMKASRSVENLYYGYARSIDIAPAFEAYLSMVSSYAGTSSAVGFGAFSWEAFKNEIDHFRPVVLLVDHDGDGETDHFITAIGYDSVDGMNLYGCYNTWDFETHWFEYRAMASGSPWGIHSVYTFSMEPPLDVTSPNGLERWIRDSEHLITWTSQIPIENVKIEYSYDNILQWSTIADSVSNSGTYRWRVPNTPSESCFIRISDATNPLISDINDAPFAITRESPISLQAVGEWSNPRGVRSLWVQGDYVYCGTGDVGYGMDVIDVADPSDPTSVGELAVTGTSEGICTRGNYSYLASGYSGLHIIDTSNPLSPTLITTYDTSGFSYDVFVQGDYAYLIDQDTATTASGMLIILDVSNPATPQLIGSAAISNFPTEIFISGNHAYISINQGGLLIYDVSSPAAPSRAAYFYMSWSNAQGVYVSGNYAFLADQFYGLQIIDVSTPTTPVLFGSYEIPQANCVYVSDGYAYVAARLYGLYVIDVSNPSEPLQTGFFDTGGTAIHVVARGGFVYIADLYSLLILRIDNFPKDDFVGTWDSQGVYFRNSDANSWTRLASPASLIACGDLDGDGVADLAGIWPGQGGVWIKNSRTSNWVKLASTARHIATGDMNGDSREDLVGTWDGQGTFYRNSITGAWVKVASPAELVTAADIDGDGTDDLIGIWPGQGGVWARLSTTSGWARLSSTALDIAAGDMNGDGREDLIGTWDSQGVYYRDSMNGAWIKMASPASQIASGDLDGDGTADLLGIWPSQGGVWVKYSNSGTWVRLSLTANDITSGRMRVAVAYSESPAATLLPGDINLPGPYGGYEPGPEGAIEQIDLSQTGPGGHRFSYREEKSIDPRAHQVARSATAHLPGPGESGFKCVEQDNPFPVEVERIPPRPAKNREKRK
jgi:hypothetical protein